MSERLERVQALIQNIKDQFDESLLSSQEHYGESYTEHIKSLSDEYRQKKSDFNWLYNYFSALQNAAADFAGTNSAVDDHRQAKLFRKHRERFKEIQRKFIEEPNHA